MKFELEPHNRDVPDDELLADLKRVAGKLGKSILTNCTCRICGISPALKPGTILEVDHIKSWDAGGETIFENLQTLCQRCNSGKNNLDLYQK